MKKFLSILLTASLLTACNSGDSAQEGQSLKEMVSEEATAASAETEIDQSTEQTVQSEVKEESVEVENDTTQTETAPSDTVKEDPIKPDTSGSIPVITWQDFFDDSSQSEPSEKLKALNGQKVKITGFMGDALDFKGGWFLMIETDGGDCPFCSADESYWNKVMVIFAKNKNYLRNIPGGVEAEGILDVGIKEDETGYNTMFRLYDAEFRSAD
ncbi:hypothetical protein FZC78_07420 [Rossellomorea vietnamensis]|uniref:Lipoprotein n=1 Tax=Rossellomorea vietnamensis TaxID=218284 RepID=A0A5D4NYA1_9BACI|nr:hypothetical protein [Rossellomorea vietnamensis]TYS17682.1 hypothetical protein FZC78_07420 [Rossellomorea vietnamensis]